MSYVFAVVHGANPAQIHAQNRVRAGVKLYKDGTVGKIMTTGRNEADELAQLAFKSGVKESDIIAEKVSRTTYENLNNVKRLFRCNDGIGAYLVSQKWHQRRLMYVADHVLGREFRHEFYEALDGRDPADMEADAKQEGPKLMIDRVTLLVPVLGGVINSAAYYALTKIRK